VRQCNSTFLQNNKFRMYGGIMNNSSLSAAVAAALGLGMGTSNAAPAAFTGLTIMDVGSNTANTTGAYSAALDGVSGAFRFGPSAIDVSTYAVASLFTGDAGTGTLLGGGAANPTGSFSTGFIFSSAPFVPFTFGSGFAGTIDTASSALSITSLDFGGYFSGNAGLNAPPFNFYTPPDSNNPLEILWAVSRGNGTDWDVAFRWGHDITSSDDPTLAYRAFTAQWVLEGCLTTRVGGQCATSAIPVPAAVWLFASGLAGLFGVSLRKHAV